MTDLPSPPASLPPPLPALTLGQVLGGRYRLLDVLGEGGMGTVYLGEHTLMRKRVAIKVLHPDLGVDETLVQRFHHEAQAAGNIVHPHICAATDFGRTADGAFFLVMEHLSGRTLQEVIEAGGAMPLARVVHIAMQVCDALELAHRMGVIHRDLKPENIMLVDQRGDPDFVKIMDFGIARVELTGTPRGPRVTEAGIVCGTPSHMSPEQATAGALDERSDLYSLGVTLFQMVTGVAPFGSGSTAEVMAMHVNAPPPSLNDVRPDLELPPRLRAIIERLLAKAPGERYPSASALRHALSESLKPAPGPWYRRWPSAIGRGVTSRIALVLLAVAGAAATTYALWPNEAPRAASADALVQSDAADAAAETVREIFAISDPTARAQAIEGLLADESGNAFVHAALGDAFASEDNWRAAMDHYDQALALEPRYSEVDTVRDWLVGQLVGGDAEPREAAALVLAQRDLRPLNASLARVATVGDSYIARKRALEFLTATGRSERLEPWQRAAIALRHDVGCKPRRQAIERLAELGDRRAMEVLKSFHDAPRSGCGADKRADCYGCIRDDLLTAIQTLAQ